jgi:hypothetical protein
MKITILVTALLLGNVGLFAKMTFDGDEQRSLHRVDSLHRYINIPKVPKQISFEAGYRNLFSVIDHSDVLADNKTMHGYGFLFDYAWQLSGLNKRKPAVYLSVPLGYSVLFAGNSSSKTISLLSYGWTIRHELNVDRSVTPFLGYGLLLNTLKLRGVEGGVMGHQTQFDFGINIKTASNIKPFAKIEYSYTSFPRMGDSKRIHFQFVDVRLGLRF